ncbi:MAG: ArsR family transcriptional regulator, partial [Candidatus Helarchaeota archaeon]
MIKRGKEEKIIETLSHCVNFGDPRKYYNELQQIQRNTEKDEEYKFLVKIMRALSNKDRLFIVDMLRTRDYCVCELEILIDKSQGATSRQLKILEDS